MTTFKGSELNRLARRAVDTRDKELKLLNQFASFSNWELIMDSPPRLNVSYGIYANRNAPYVKGKRNRPKLHNAVISITLD
jgi:hypothetical protein